MTDTARAENRILSDMTGMALSTHSYMDAIGSALDLVREAVSSPFLSLAIQESERVGFYPRVGAGVDMLWADDLSRQVEEASRAHLQSPSVIRPRATEQHITAPPAWIATFSAQSRSGRACAVTLGSPRPFELQKEEEEVMARLVRQVLLVLDHALLLEQRESLESVDPLTGLANHRRLLEILDYEIRRHRFLERRLALVLLDVEGLDGINRSYGRQYGSHILVRLAVLLRESVRPIDIVARCGMDEFAVVLPEMGEEEAQERADRLRERILAARFAGGGIGVTAGVAHARPDETIDAERFLRRGEQVLHAAKRQERDWSERIVSGPRVLR